MQRAGATAGLAGLIAKGRNLLVQQDAAVEHHFDREARFYLEWKIAIRVGTPPVRKKRATQVAPASACGRNRTADANVVLHPAT